LTEDNVIADVGSGTAILARLFLDNGNRVIAVEPNDEMRRAGELLLSAYGRFGSVTGTAEATTLPQSSVDLIAVGQAFHWFDPAQARREFARVLTGGGRVILVWNDRRKHGESFQEAYEKLLETYASDYADVERGRKGSLENIRSFFAPNPVHTATFGNRQVLDYDGLLGRLRSSSYVPAGGRSGHSEMLDELQRIFREHEHGGRVVMEYDTQAYCGLLAGGDGDT
jgi:SAM-dependent methyltransferase